MKNINTIGYWNGVYMFENYDTWRKYPSTFRCVKKLAVTTLDVHSPFRVAEFGCGVGILAEEIISESPSVEVHGFDISKVAIRDAYKRNPRRFTGFITSLPPSPVANSQYNCTIASEFLEHFEEPWHVVRDMERITVDGGLIIVVVPDGILPPEECKEHYQCFTEHTLRKLLMRIDAVPQIIKITDEWTTNDKRFKIPVLIGVCRVRK